MRVVKHGNMKYYREIEHTCATCGCEFTFILADICTKFDVVEDKFTSCNYVSCPECKTAYILNQDDNKPADGGSDVPDPEPVDPEDVNPPDSVDPELEPEPVDPEPVDPNEGD